MIKCNACAKVAYRPDMVYVHAHTTLVRSISLSVRMHK